MTEDATAEPQRELTELWREWLTQSERQMNAFLGQAMSSDTAGRGMGGFVELYAVFQRNMTQAMERYLAAMNIPSRTDITSLAEKLSSIEERLLRIEQTLLIAAESVDGHQHKDEYAGPARTRLPWSDDGAGPRAGDTSPAPALPEELKR